MKKRVISLRSTGSIGTNTLEVIARLRERFGVVGIAAHSNWNRLAQQAARWQPRWVAIADGQGDVGLVSTKTNVKFDDFWFSRADGFVTPPTRAGTAARP